MIKKRITQLNTFPLKRIYWLSYIIIGLILLATALYFQHMLEELPCLICIQIRLLISLLIIVSIAGLLLRHSRWLALVHLSVAAIAIAMVERSYMLLGTERGFVFADCGFELGLPAWLPLEQVLPWLYRVETSCGYTPELIFGITMAEALMVMSVLFLLISFGLVLASFLRLLTSD
ncbi:MAG TPA: disulfide bond formation protein B [Gammaproteobacteria bacterium]|nr:disulfide bond formation protein B [Gammaproteobacteria bacterium]